MKTITILLSIFILNACSTITYTSVNIYSDSPGLVCKDEGVLKLKGYEIPSPPDMSKLPKGKDAELLALLDYIDVLKADLRAVAKDYGCSK